MFISVDPGENVGVATFKHDGSDISKTTMRLPQFRLFLRSCLSASETNSNLTFKFIMEDYNLRQNMALNQVGSDMPASRCIGAVEMIDEILGDKSTIELQKPGVLRTALKWAGYSELANKPRHWHCPDDISAYAHGVFWLINNDYRKHPIFQEDL